MQMKIVPATVIHNSVVSYHILSLENKNTRSQLRPLYYSIQRANHAQYSFKTATLNATQHTQTYTQHNETLHNTTHYTDLCTGHLFLSSVHNTTIYF